MLSKLLFIPLLLFGCASSSAQYLLNRLQYNEHLPILSTEEPYSKIFFHKAGDKIRLYRRWRRADSSIISVEQLNSSTFFLERIDTIRCSGGSFRLSDFAGTARYDVVLGFDRIVVYDRHTRNTSYIKSDSYDFDKGRIINDSIILLNVQSNFHPLDAYAGLHMQLFNLRTMSFVRSVKIRVPGIALAHMTINWVISSGDFIYNVSPLSGILYKFNSKLEQVSQAKLPIPWNNYAKNAAYEHYTDSLLYTNWDTLHNLYERIGKDSIAKNYQVTQVFPYAKESIVDFSKKARGEMEFIEKLIPYNDSTFIITVSRPGYGYKFRDLFFYNPSTNKIARSYLKWRCGRADTSYKIEDYFPVDVINDASTAPIFMANKIIYFTIYDPVLYQNGLKDSISKRMLGNVYKNNYTWKLLEYQLQ